MRTLVTILSYHFLFSFASCSDYINYAAALFESGSEEEAPINKPFFRVKDTAFGMIQLPNGYVVDCTGKDFKDELEDPWQLFRLQFHKGKMCSYARMESMLREKKAAYHMNEVLFRPQPIFLILPCICINFLFSVHACLLGWTLSLECEEKA